MDTGAHSGAQQPLGQWTTGLFGCFEDLGNCFMTGCFSCIAFGQIAEVIDRGSTSCAWAGLVYTASPWLFSYPYRTKLRGLYNLPAEPCGDLCVHCWCTPCAICQEYRELKNRGIDPSLGWAGNEEKMNSAANQVPPSIASGMTR